MPYLKVADLPASRYCLNGVIMLTNKTLNMLKLLLYLLRIVEKSLKEEFKDDSIVLTLSINNDKFANVIPNMKET